MLKLITITPNKWDNQAEHLNIYIDDVKAGVVGINQTLYIDVSTSKHKVVLRTKWTSAASQ